MHRALYVASVLAVVLLALLIADRSLSTEAQDASVNGGHDLVGSWRLKVTETQTPPFLALGTFGAEGTVVVSPPPVVPPSPRGPATVVHTSAGHGAWKATGPDTAILSFVLLAADAEGNPFATRTVRASITLGADRQRLSGELVATIADPTGNAVATESGTIEATHLVAEAPGTSSATPMSGTPVA